MPIPDSPLPVIVHPKNYVETTSIGNVKDPWGVAVNDRGEIIVSEYSTLFAICFPIQYQRFSY